MHVAYSAERLLGRQHRLKGGFRRRKARGLVPSIREKGFQFAQHVIDLLRRMFHGGFDVVENLVELGLIFGFAHHADQGFSPGFTDQKPP